MSLKQELSDLYTQFHKNTPELAGVASTIRTVTAQHKASFDPNLVIKPGTPLPPFTLPDATSTPVSSTSLLANGPLLISFYPGSWCPYCNLELRALQKQPPDFCKRGVTLVAISAELPDTSLDTKEKLELEFPVLSDVGNVYARQLGIVWKQPDVMKDVLAYADWKIRYGDEEMEIPVAGTFLVDKGGVVRNVYMEANWHERLEPEVAVGWIDALEMEG